MTHERHFASSAGDSPFAVEPRVVFSFAMHRGAWSTGLRSPANPTAARLQRCRHGERGSVLRSKIRRRAGDMDPGLVVWTNVNQPVATEEKALRLS